MPAKSHHIKQSLNQQFPTPHGWYRYNTRCYYTIIDARHSGSRTRDGQPSHEVLVAQITDDGSADDGTDGSTIRYIISKPLPPPDRPLTTISKAHAFARRAIHGLMSPGERLHV